MVLEGAKKTWRNVPLLRRHVVYDCAHRQAGLSRPSRRDKPFLEISIYLWIIEKGQYITDMYVYMKRGVIGEQELLVKSYRKMRKCTYKCTWFVCLFIFDDILIILHLWYHVIKPAEHPVSDPFIISLLSSSHCWSLILSSIVPNYRSWRHITQYSAMDLSRCLEPALFRLFPIRQAASAGPQPAREWKSLARVIFGKCRVHRNPGAWSPVSARHPRLTITKERWRHCAAPECRWVEEKQQKIAQQLLSIKGRYCCSREETFPAWLFDCAGGELIGAAVYCTFFGTTHKQQRPQPCLRWGATRWAVLWHWELHGPMRWSKIGRCF